MNMVHSTAPVVLLICWLLSHSEVGLGEKVPEDLIDLDDPVFTLKLPDYMEAQKRTADDKSPPVVIYSDYNVCYHETPIRYTFGNEQVIDLAHAIPIEWSNYLSVMSYIFTVPLYELLKQGAVEQVLMPFIFPVLMATIAVLAIIPYIIVGCVVWAIVFNLRIFGRKRVRMAIRSILIRFEKYRRWKYERSFPVPHLRKFRERDRYQMPKAFQNSDLSSDDEPLELTREQIPRKTTTMWKKEEIDLIGFDPDNIPMDTVYGDLLGNPERLDPNVRKYTTDKSRKKPKSGANRERGGQSFSSDEWVEAIQQQMLERKEAERKKSVGILETLKNKLLHGSEGEKNLENVETASSVPSLKKVPSKTSTAMSLDEKKLAPKIPGEKLKTPKKPLPLKTKQGVVVQTIPNNLYKPRGPKLDYVKSKPNFPPPPPSFPPKRYGTPNKPPVIPMVMKPTNQSPISTKSPPLPPPSPRPAMGMGTMGIQKAKSTTNVQNKKQPSGISPDREKPVENRKKKKSHFKQIKKKEPRRRWRLT